MPLEPDIVEKINEQFAHADAREAVALLEGAGKSGRTARCMVFGARGSLAELRLFLARDEDDWRDAFMVENDEDGWPLRDFSCSFLIDAPEKFWISKVARALAGRGYTLKSLDTVPAEISSTAPSLPRAGTARRAVPTSGEGSATFEGSLGLLTVVKRSGQWSLLGDPAVLSLFDLDRTFTDEAKFRDAISCFILARENPKPG
jgi:hypothetical protein